MKRGEPPASGHRWPLYCISPLVADSRPPRHCSCGVAGSTMDEGMTREDTTMRLTDLYAALPDAALVGPRDAAITGIADDSRAVRPGDLFVAVPGERVDGHRFIDAAVARGAAAVLCQIAPADTLPVPHIVVPDARAALADVAAAFYGHPSTRLRVVGVTGTDGKTTTCFLLHALLQGTGRSAGLSSTVAVRVGAQSWPTTTGYTTPPRPRSSASWRRWPRLAAPMPWSRRPATPSCSIACAAAMSTPRS